MRIQLHRCADDVRGFGSCAVEQSHLVHGEQQLAVRGLEAVNLGNRTRENDAHGVGHEILADGGNNRLLYHLTGAVDNAVKLFGLLRLGCFFSGQYVPPPQLTSRLSIYS